MIVVDVVCLIIPFLHDFERQAAADSRSEDFDNQIVQPVQVRFCSLQEQFFGAFHIDFSTYVF